MWSTPTQAIESADTSINKNKLPQTAKLVKWERGTVNADIGGGRFDNFTEFLAEQGVTNYIFDPFNRSKEFNELSASKLRGGQADTVTVNNVLNVIQERDGRLRVIQQASDALKAGAVAYFLIYEGNKSGVGGVSKSKGGVATCWQENRKAATYVEEIKEVFNNVAIKGNLITAS